MARFSNIGKKLLIFVLSSKILGQEIKEIKWADVGEGISIEW